MFLSLATDVADLLCEFVEVAIHIILYLRSVYPQGMPIFYVLKT